MQKITFSILALLFLFSCQEPEVLDWHTEENLVTADVKWEAWRTGAMTEKEWIGEYRHQFTDTSGRIGVIIPDTTMELTATTRAEGIKKVRALLQVIHIEPEEGLTVDVWEITDTFWMEVNINNNPSGQPYIESIFREQTTTDIDSIRIILPRLIYSNRVVCQAFSEEGKNASIYICTCQEETKRVLTEAGYAVHHDIPEPENPGTIAWTENPDSPTIEE